MESKDTPGEEEDQNSRGTLLTVSDISDDAQHVVAFFYPGRQQDPVRRLLRLEVLHRNHRVASPEDRVPEGVGQRQVVVEPVGAGQGELGGEPEALRRADGERAQCGNGADGDNDVRRGVAPSVDCEDAAAVQNKLNQKQQEQRTLAGAASRDDAAVVATTQSTNGVHHRPTETRRWIWASGHPGG